VAAVLTVVIETPILAIAGYRSRRFILACVLVNIATNLALNLGVAIQRTYWAANATLGGSHHWIVLITAEICVVVVEWAVLRLVAADGEPVPWRSRAAGRLLIFVFVANLTSFLVGVIWWR